MGDYAEFLRRKQQYGADKGFEPLWMPSFLYDFQTYLVGWAVRKGRAAIFADCGLGKTPMQLVWAQNVVQKENRSALILTPLAVTGQTLEEADKFGIEARRAQPGQDGMAIIEVTNYEKLHLFEPGGYAGVVCDECFVADTPVDTLEGTRTISNIRPGDYIYTAAGLQKVRATHTRYADSLVLTSIQGRDIISSENHLFFTRRGWVKAKNLKEGDYVVSTRDAMRMVWEATDSSTSQEPSECRTEETRQARFLRSLLLCEMENETTRDSSEGTFTRGRSEAGSETPSMATIREPRCTERDRENTKLESDVQPGNQSKGISDFACDRTQTESERRERQTDASPTEKVIECSRQRMARRVYSEFRKDDTRLPVTLQDRYCESRLDGSDRGRRVQSHCCCETGTRRKERCQTPGARVDSVTIYKSDDTLFSRYRDGTGQVVLYDLEMQGHPSFSIHGFLVHNSSILKNFRGVRRTQITEFMRTIPYRLLCTATAAPNDWTELGTSSEALGYLGQRDMLSRFFTRKPVYAHNRNQKEWNIRPWAEQGPFWQWLASWARTARKPSDLGFDDDGFILPPLRTKETNVQANKPTPGMLFDMPAVTFHEEREAIRRTIQERCESAAESIAANGESSMVWCNLNSEGDMLEKLIPDAVQVSGSDSDEKKEEAARWFVHGKGRRVLISKPTIFGFGLNFQHCAHMTYFPTWSYEQYYQATRRLWRFGQTRPVTVDLIYTDGGKRMLEGLNTKAQHADEMFDNLVAHMSHELNIKETYKQHRIEVPKWMR